MGQERSCQRTIWLEDWRGRELLLKLVSVTRLQESCRYIPVSKLAVVFNEYRRKAQSVYPECRIANICLEKHCFHIVNINGNVIYFFGWLFIVLIQHWIWPKGRKGFAFINATCTNTRFLLTSLITSIKPVYNQQFLTDIVGKRIS